MAEAYPLELRQRVVEAYERGDGSFVTIAEKIQVGEATINRWVSQYRDLGHFKARPKAGGVRSDVSLKELEAILEPAR